MLRKPTKIGRRYLKFTAPLFSVRHTMTSVHIRVDKLKHAPGPFSARPFLYVKCLANLN
jgi:hypothetical protein